MKNLVLLMLMLTATTSIFAGSKTAVENVKLNNSVLLNQKNGIKNAVKSNTQDSIKVQSLKPIKVKKIYV